MRFARLLVCLLFLPQSLFALPQVRKAEDPYQRATELVRAGNLHQALQELQKALQHTPRNPKVHNMLGVVLTELGRLKEANEAYDRALSIAPDFRPARKNRAINAFTQGDFKFAASEFEDLARLEPKDFVPHLFLGLLAMEGSDLKTARKHLLEARQLSPDNGRVLLALTRVHFALGERQLAIESAQAMRAKSPSTDAERFELGVILAQFAANAEAAEVFHELWLKKPGAYDTGFNLALVYYRTGQLEPALRIVKELGSGAKPSGELLNLQGWIYNKMRRLDQARESLHQATAAEPDNPDHYLDLSTVLNNQGETEAAIQALSGAIQHGLEKARLQVQMGLLYEKSGKYAEAEKCYRVALTSNKATPPAYLALAHLLLGTDRRKEALDLLVHATRSFPRDPLLHYMYGAELLESTQESNPEQWGKAESVLRKALELNPFYANTLYMLGRLYVKRGDDDSAQDYFERACAFNPRHADAYYQWLRIAVRRGEKSKAAELDKIVRKLHDEEKRQDQETVTGLVEESLRGPVKGTLVTKAAN